MITIIDYGVGNLGSVQNMLKFLSIPSQISSDASVIEKSSKLLLPGVGSWDNGMDKLKTSKFFPCFEELVLDRKVPLLGICLGMQILLESSEEGHMPGLGWIDGTVSKFNFDPASKLKVPHMGWNLVQPVCTNPLTSSFEEETRFYFVHSYHANNIKSENQLIKSHYGYDFVSGIHKDNIWGVQFHPEKSHKFGMKLLKSFSEL